MEATTPLVFNNPDEASDWLMTNPNPTQEQQVAVLHACNTLNQVLHTCRLTHTQKIALIRQGINTTTKLFSLGASRATLKTTLSLVADLPPHRGVVKFDTQTITNLAALIKFCENRCDRGLPLIPNAFDLDIWIERAYDSGSLHDDASDSGTHKPQQFMEESYHTWRKSLNHYLSTIKSASGAPLSYIIRPELLAGHQYVDDADRRYYEEPLSGENYQADNAKVASLTLELVQPTNGHEYIRDLPTDDGRAMFMALQGHYDDDTRSHGSESRSENSMTHSTYISKFRSVRDLFTDERVMSDILYRLPDYQRLKNDPALRPRLRVLIGPCLTCMTYPISVDYGTCMNCIHNEYGRLPTRTEQAVNAIMAYANRGFLKGKRANIILERLAPHLTTPNRMTKMEVGTTHAPAYRGHRYRRL